MNTMPHTSTITKSQKRLLLLSSLGGVLEFYDFIIYIFLAPILEKLFFADNSHYVATLKTLAIFSVGYLLRPLGGIVFSHFGDRHGRKTVFLFTVIFMAVPSFAIGMLPTTQTIGNVAPVLLLIFRMMQGLALGGEIPAAMTFVSEHVPKGKLGFAQSTLFFGVNTGLLLGSFVTALMTTFLSAESILAFGWRIPFLLGGFFGLCALFLRRHLHETAAFKAMQPSELQRIPFLALMKKAKSNVIQGTLLVATGSVTVFIYLYCPQYLHQYLNYDFNTMMRINTFGTLLLNIFILIGGVLVDRFGPRHLYLIITSLLIIMIWPLFALFQLKTISSVMLSYFIFSTLFGIIPACYTSILCNLFPTSVRYSGIALCYNFAYAIFGGLSPVICTLAIHAFNSILAPAYYIMAVAAMSWLACYLGKKSESTKSLAMTLQDAQS